MKAEEPEDRLGHVRAAKFIKRVFFNLIVCREENTV